VPNKITKKLSCQLIAIYLERLLADHETLILRSSENTYMSEVIHENGRKAIQEIWDFLILISNKDKEVNNNEKT